jgi:hypothetical protein
LTWHTLKAALEQSAEASDQFVSNEASPEGVL